MKVSVIVPIFNVRKYLDDFLRSLTMQEFLDVEFILIDDASTDNCDEIISKYDDERIVYIKKEVNEGLYKARQDGFDISKGTYVINLDPDDLISNSFISNLYDAARRDNLDIVVCNVSLIDEDGKELKSVKSKREPKSFHFNEDRYHSLLSIPYATWCRLIKKELIIKQSYTYNQGELFLTNFHFLKNVRSGFCSTSEYYYRIRDNSLSSHVNSVKRLHDSISMDKLDLFYKELSNLDVDHKLIQYYSLFNYISNIKLIYTSSLYKYDYKKYIALDKHLRQLTSFNKWSSLKAINYMSFELKLFTMLNFFGLIPSVIFLKGFFKR
ncbi:glycosyltransferase family 2 protein [Moritella sp. 36]|uniref:glycosyltransferase family 2 protein n=1 Tax=Moritella sp. 36 TaxID=2746233 RepID=UPI001BA47E31|nr:glycosyltransferase family 2 protein [Moritella sp. 36]QUM87889.1 glycosyltransferase family 2 protein [Moritella sp. 36]